MVCEPIPQPNFSPPSFSGGGGFAIPLPSLNLLLPPIDMPDLSELYKLLTLITPVGPMKVNFSAHFLNTIFDGINDLLSKFTPFLMLYKFFLPVLNLILCIIEVLCAIMNPFKLASAIIKLFRTCIPEFLALFPYFALIIMIISLILLIISLIIYLIETIIIMILIIIQNIIALGRAVQRSEEDSIIAIIKKVGDLLCFLQNLFVIFGFILLIIQIIKAILSLSFKIPPCDSSDNSDNGCCTPDVCPDFIKNNSDITTSTGNLLYYNQVGVDSGLVLPAFFPPIVATVRQESWQFYDAHLSKRQAFINITQAYDLPSGVSKVFFPGGTTYNALTDPNSTPYIMSFRFFYDPAVFNATDSQGARFVRVANVIIQNPPTFGTSSFDGVSSVGPFNGTLNLIGGVMTEDDGTNILDANGKILSLNSFIHLPTDNSGIATDNGILFPNLTYTFTINHEVLLGYSLITLGCIPEVATNRDFINTTIGAQFNLNGAKLANVVNILPDVAATQACLTNAISTFRQNVSVASANDFQTNIINCLNDLKGQTTNALSAVVSAGFDQYKSDFSISPSIQFTTQPIQVSVSLNESSSQLMTANLPPESSIQLAGDLSGSVSLGKISSFAYDGYNFFVAEITSDTPGNGTVKVAFNNNFISILNNPTILTETPSVIVKELQYTFVNSPAASDAGQPRRDEGDISRDGSGD